MSTAALHAAFRAALLEVSPAPSAIHWQGEVFTPPDRAAFMRERLAEIGRPQRTFGGDGGLDQQGTYTVDIFVPVIEGGYDLDALRATVDAVASRFKPGRVIGSALASPAHVRSVAPSPVVEQAEDALVSVTVNWLRHIPNA